MKDFDPGEPAHQVHRLSPRALEVVEEVMNDTSKPAKVRLEAATLVLAYAHGSPSQEIMNTSRKRHIDEFSDDEILAILSSAATEVQASGPIFPGSADESLVSYARPGGCDLERGLQPPSNTTTATPPPAAVTGTPTGPVVMPAPPMPTTAIPQ